MAQSRISFLIPALAVLVACSSGTETVAYVETLGSDTTAIEVYQRTDERIEGDLVIRMPETRVIHYFASLTPEGLISRLELAASTPAENPGGPPPEKITIAIEGDSATVERTGGSNAGTMRVAVDRNTIPIVGTPMAFAFHEQAVRQALAAGGETVPISLLTPGRPRTTPNAIVLRGADSVSMDFFGNPIVARIDETGRILGRSGRETTMKVEGRLVDDIELRRLAAEFAARDARGEGIGVASPGATVQTSVGGANFEVVYSQPAKRGREIWGGLVPYGEVWRTGANAATMFTTDRDLTIGGENVPAGSYTLWTTFTAESAQLIINSQTGQWGTAYDESQDFVRVDLEPESVPEMVERFTISIEEADGGGTLHLTWDMTRYSVGFQVR
jgi:hypothetical protein